jgi:ribosome maturation factor RimP
MHRQNQALIDLFGPEIGALGYELLGIELGQNGKGSILRVYIDKEDGITIDDCVLVSQQLTGLLDVEDPIEGKYDLEVSSPGMDRPLFTLDQFSRYVGQKVNLRLHTKLEGRRRFIGMLLAIENENVVIDCDNEELVVPFNMIEKAKLVPEY